MGRQFGAVETTHALHWGSPHFWRRSTGSQLLQRAALSNWETNIQSVIFRARHALVTGKTDWEREERTWRKIEKQYEKSKKDNKKTVRDAIGFLPAIYPLEEPIKEGKKNISHYSVDNNISQHIPRYNNKRDIKMIRALILTFLIAHKISKSYQFYWIPRLINY